MISEGISHCQDLVYLYFLKKLPEELECSRLFMEFLLGEKRGYEVKFNRVGGKE